MMLSLCCKRLKLLLPSRIISVNPVTHLHFCQNPPLYSSKSLLGSENGNPKQEDKAAHLFTVSYLMNSCGMSPEIALNVSENVHFETRERPDSVIKLLKDYGLSDAHISVLVEKLPRLLLYNADILLPKLEFFGSIGITGTALANTILRNPIILTRSLEKCILPCYDLIKSILVDDKRVATFFKTSKCAVSADSLRCVVSNIDILRGLQVPDSTISVYLTWYPLMLCRKTEFIKEDVNRVMSMGIAPSSSSTFMRAIVAIILVGASKWEQKMQFFKGWGWTEDDIMSAFRQNPLFITLSEKNVSSKMDFLLNKMGWQPADVAQNSYVFGYNLEKRIIPICSVIRVLQLKGIIKKRACSLVTMLKKSEKCLITFLLKYQQQVPEILSIYQGKTSLAELGLGFEER